MGGTEATERPRAAGAGLGALVVGRTGRCFFATSGDGHRSVRCDALLQQLGRNLVDGKAGVSGAQLPERIPAALRTLDATPRPLLHGDLRLDNALLRPVGCKPVFIDWQGLTIGPKRAAAVFSLVCCGLFVTGTHRVR